MFALKRATHSALRRSLLRQPCAWLSTSRFIIHASGIDRVGMVSDISGQVIQNGGNVADSAAARLGQYFSLMMLVDLPANKSDDLRQSLSSMSGIDAAVFEAKDSTEFVPRVAYSGYFTLEGADNPGIVHTLTSALAAHGLSIDRMETDQELAPMGGTTLFRMRGVCNAFEPLPKSFDANAVRHELERLGNSLNCEVTLEDNHDDDSSGAFFVG